MRIIRKGVMPNPMPRVRATDVQIEDWEKGYCVATYPISKSWLPRTLRKKEHERFRLALWFDSEDEATACFEALTNGAQIADYADHAERPELVPYVMTETPEFRWPHKSAT